MSDANIYFFGVCFFVKEKKYSRVEKLVCVMRLEYHDTCYWRYLIDRCCRTFPRVHACEFSKKGMKNRKNIWLKVFFYTVTYIVHVWMWYNATNRRIVCAMSRCCDILFFFSLLLPTLCKYMYIYIYICIFFFRVLICMRKWYVRTVSLESHPFSIHKKIYIHFFLSRSLIPTTRYSKHKNQLYFDVSLYSNCIWGENEKGFDKSENVYLSKSGEKYIKK